MRAVRASRAARLEVCDGARCDGLVRDWFFFAVDFGFALGALALPVSAFAFFEACAFETGSFALGIVGAEDTGASAGVDCAGDGGAKMHALAANAASASREFNDRGNNQAMIPLYAELDASERRGESLA
jgi:hypothetical protein